MNFFLQRGQNYSKMYGTEPSFHNNMAELFLFLGFSEWEDESILAAVLAESQKEYLEKLKKGALKEKCGDEDSKS